MAHCSLQARQQHLPEVIIQQPHRAQVLTYLMLTSVAAVVEILYLAYNGDTNVSWSEACNSFGRFCNRMKMALVLHTIALLCFFTMSLISSYRVFSKFDPPHVPSEEIERETS